MPRNLFVAALAAVMLLFAALSVDAQISRWVSFGTSTSLQFLDRLSLGDSEGPYYISAGVVKPHLEGNFQLRLHPRFMAGAEAALSTSPKALGYPNNDNYRFFIGTEVPLIPWSDNTDSTNAAHRLLFFSRVDAVNTVTQRDGSRNRTWGQGIAAGFAYDRNTFWQIRLRFTHARFTIPRPGRNNPEEIYRAYGVHLGLQFYPWRKV